MLPNQVSDTASSPPARGCSPVTSPYLPPAIVVPARAGVFPVPGGSPRTAVGRPRPRGGVPLIESVEHIEAASSPPARGCSAHRHCRPDRVDVVPARAGVFPRSPWAPAQACRSSPPARGCSAGYPGDHVRVGVVPARAGVFRAWAARGPGCDRRPRPRGGVPLTPMSRPAITLSSPPARGCSCGAPAIAGYVHVVPARAGVFRRCQRRGQRRGRRPRPRGGVPTGIDQGTSAVVSSPPARGCSGHPRAVAPEQGVVPARAGVFLHHVGGRGCDQRRPRPRGGVPVCSPLVSAHIASSPPARGCSVTLVSPRGNEVVVPARAGVFRTAPGRHRGPGGRPRPRGGVPFYVQETTNPESSSPPARGCSVLRRREPGDRDVVPARAGVFPLPSILRTPLVGRPRPRGGVPRPVDPSSAPGRSSPPARGCSLRPDRGGREGLVVPARAGVFPRCRPHPPRSRCRPRPRGGVPTTETTRLLVTGSSPPARGCSPGPADR